MTLAKFMRFIKFSFMTTLFFMQFACTSSEAKLNQIQPEITPTPLTPIIIADSFAYPISKTETVTEAKDKKDEWYNALNFGENNHLGEDWNKNSGGNTDCGESVYAAANGRIVYAENAGIGWGNVIIIEHTLASGEKVQSLYGHLLEILKTSGAAVKKRELIGKVGNADGRYLCHLHFEMRLSDCPMWNRAGDGYSADRRGWTDPSNFIDKHK
jgi:murein DD-endopeptidase MepM/ murein hydrolase activator NlpD